MTIRTLVPALGCVLALTIGCGSETTARVEPPAPAATTEVPTDLTCPTDERVATAGGFFARMPDGLPTPEQAVEVWLDGNKAIKDAAGFVLDEDRKSAWILREDGTAVAQVDFFRHSGYSVHGYQACSS